jgi:hypothetical protein
MFVGTVHIKRNIGVNRMFSGMFFWDLLVKRKGPARKQAPFTKTKARLFI